MKNVISILLVCLLLAGCGTNTVAEVTTVPAEATLPTAFCGTMPLEDNPVDYISRFSSETVIFLSDEGITVNGSGETESVFTSHDILCYEDRETYDSGNPYGEGDVHQRHTAQEAAAHTVVNITEPGAYRVSGTLSAGQIRVDLGNAAYFDPEAVVELILEDADITCTVAPAIVFLNTYECDGSWSVDSAKAEVDTSAAGANLILEGENIVAGSHVAKIYKDQPGEKKLWKQDGAVYSYMSLNVFGPGVLTIHADNEGLDTELHLTVNGGDLRIFSDNDGINTNEDGVSVTTINAGSVHIMAGLGEEGDGIDSNGYLVINGGTVVASANPAADAGLDADLGSYVNGGTVLALGSTMDWAESDSDQVTMNLRFADLQSSGSAIVVSTADGTTVFAYDPSEDEILAENTRRYMGAVISCPGFRQGDSYLVYLDGTLTGEETDGMYTAVTAYEGGIQMGYTGTDVDMGGFPGMERPQVTDGEMPAMPEGFEPGEMPEDGFGGGRGQRPQGNPEGMTPPEGFDGEMPTMPEGETFPRAEMPKGSFGSPGEGGMQPDTPGGEVSTEFYMNDKVNAFSGVIAA